MTPELRQKYLDLFASVEPDHAMKIIIDNMTEEARDLGERLPGGGERMMQMVHMRAFWLGMMREAGLRVVRDEK